LKKEAKDFCSFGFGVNTQHERVTKRAKVFLLLFLQKKKNPFFFYDNFMTR